jgi:integrase
LTNLRLKYVQALTDRHGRRRHYFRKAGMAPVPLPGLPGSREFMTAYQAALTGSPLVRIIGAERTRPGSFSALIIDYYASTYFKALQPITQKAYRHVIERFRDEYGDLSVAGLQPGHIRKLLDRHADRPGAANDLLKKLRILMKFAVEYGYRPDNPARDIRKIRTVSTGYRSWTEDDIARFEAHWPSGSRERLALRLLLYTAQRRSDVIGMGRQHVTGQTIAVAQSKSLGRTRLTLPIAPALAEVLAQVAPGQMTFIQTREGKPMTAAGFGNWFAASAKAAGLPDHSSAHGLRKAAARRLAEAGCSPAQIKAITGHKGLAEVALYTAAADQKRLAHDAMAMQALDENRTRTVKPSGKV